MSWSGLAEWWVKEVDSDPAYETVVTPMLLDLLRPAPGLTYLDLGCGEGRVMARIVQSGSLVIGVDETEALAVRASHWGPVLVASLPHLGCLRPDSVDGTYCVLVLEHIEHHRELFRALADVVRPDGVLSLVANHPIWTAPGSTPIEDTHGEVLWRSGEYFSAGHTDEPAGNLTVRFHHRTISSLLNAAADAGWTLEEMMEAPHHRNLEQGGIPRLLGCRWRLLPS